MTSAAVAVLKQDRLELSLIPVALHQQHDVTRSVVLQLLPSAVEFEIVKPALAAEKKQPLERNVLETHPMISEQQRHVHSKIRYLSVL